MKILAYCPDCNGTGIYRGFGEGDGFGIVCSTCEGTGAVEKEIKEFTGRRLRKDIQVVGYPAPYKQWAGFYLTGISYDEFLNGDMPEKLTREQQEEVFNQKRINHGL